MEIIVTFNHTEIEGLIKKEVERQGLIVKEIRIEVTPGSQRDPAMISAKATVNKAVQYTDRDR